MMSISTISSSLQTSFAQLSSGKRINQAKDDAAGLAISQSMQGQIGGDSVAIRNMQDSDSMIEVAGGALNESSSILQDMRQLAIQANNGTMTESDRTVIQQQFSQLRDSLNQIGSYTQFNTKNLLDGSSNNVTTTTNANGDTLSIRFGDQANKLGDSSGKTLMDINLSTAPQDALQIIDGAIQQATDSRVNIGVTQNRIFSATSVARTSELNLEAANSNIVDADLASQSINLHHSDISQQVYIATQHMKESMLGQSLNLLV
jgi:flagellin